MFCGKSNCKKLEKVQERALRIIYKDNISTYVALLDQSGVLPLYLLRLKHLAIETFKCIKGYNPKYLNDMFTKKRQNYNLRDSDLLVQKKFNTFKYGYKSFSYYGAKLWNSLPNDLKCVSSTNAFKVSIDKWIRTPDAGKLIF